MKNNSVHLMIFSPNQISNMILFFMLLVRLLDHYFADWLFVSKAPAWFSYMYVFSAYILTILMLWINKNDLADMNINFSFIGFILFGGALLFLYMPIELGVVLSAVMIFFYLEVRNGKFDIRENNYHSLWVWFTGVSAIGFAWLPVLLFSLTAKTAFSANVVSQALFQAHLPLVVFEEILFRGALVAFLRRSGFREFTILIIPTILFWISHHKYVLLHNTYIFWVPLPLLSLLFGIASLKSKSLIPSTIAHFLFNFTSSIIRIIY